jgi:hypothetical protein
MLSKVTGGDCEVVVVTLMMYWRWDTSWGKSRGFFSFRKAADAMKRESCFQKRPAVLEIRCRGEQGRSREEGEREREMK